jgi:hypothetical protein
VRNTYLNVDYHRKEFIMQKPETLAGITHDIQSNFGRYYAKLLMQFNTEYQSN